MNNYVSNHEMSEKFSRWLNSLLSEGYQFYFFKDFSWTDFKKAVFLTKDNQLYLLVHHQRGLSNIEVVEEVLSFVKPNQEYQENVEEGYLISERYFMRKAIVEDEITLGFSFYRESQGEYITFRLKDLALEAISKAKARKQRDKENELSTPLPIGPCIPHNRLVQKKEISYLMRVNSEIPGFKKNALLVHIKKEFFLVSKNGRVLCISSTRNSKSREHDTTYITSSFDDRSLLHTITRA